jgi:hypothetical protein
MRIVIHPVLEPRREIDVTRRLVSAIAEEIWRLYGGSSQLNWLEAERHLERIVEEARSLASRAEVAGLPGASGDPAQTTRSRNARLDGLREPKSPARDRRTALAH